MVPDLLAPTDEIRAMCVHVGRSLRDVERWLVAQLDQQSSNKEGLSHSGRSTTRLT